MNENTIIKFESEEIRKPCTKRRESNRTRELVTIRGDLERHAFQVATITHNARSSRLVKAITLVCGDFESDFSTGGERTISNEYMTRKRATGLFLRSWVRGRHI
jgi:hypothetical protein